MNTNPKKLIIPIALLPITAGLFQLFLTFSSVEFFYNTSKSAPVGLYFITNEQTTRGDWVVFYPPKHIQDFMGEVPWLREGTPFIKQIGATVGEEVCVVEEHFQINGETKAPVFRVDGEGRPLPNLSGCLKIEEGEFFPVSLLHPTSFDGRYMGPIETKQILGKARPLITFGRTTL